MLLIEQLSKVWRTAFEYGLLLGCKDTTAYERFYIAAKYDVFSKPSVLRELGIRRFGYAILTHRAATSVVDFLLSVSTTELRDLILLDYGAGAGYWAHELRCRLPKSFDVQACDPHPEWYCYERWFEVRKAGGAPLLNSVSPDVLLLIWPNWADDVAVEGLLAFEGRALVYCGEQRGGSTANDAFFDELERNWELTQSVKIPQWPGNDDRIFLFVRR